MTTMEHPARTTKRGRGPNRPMLDRLEERLDGWLYDQLKGKIICDPDGTPLKDENGRLVRTPPCANLLNVVRLRVRDLQREFIAKGGVPAGATDRVLKAAQQRFGGAA